MSLLLIAAAVATTVAEPPKTTAYRATPADIAAMQPYASCFRSTPTPVAGRGEAVQRLGELPKANEYKLVMRSGPECMRPSDVRYNVEDQLRRARPAGAQPSRR